MNLLELHTTYLLSRHDCVTVPGFGAFVAQYTPASIDYERGVITPPRRVIGFNSELDHNDGLLAASIARSRGVSFAQAMHLISDEVGAIRRDLLSEGRVMMANIGAFTINPDGSIIFDPRPSALIMPGLYNLDNVELKSVREAARQEAIATGAYKPERGQGIGSRVRAGLRIAASVALLIGLGALLSTPIVVDNHADYASVNPVAAVTPPRSTSPAELLPRAVNIRTLYIAAPGVDGSASIDTARRADYASRVLQYKQYQEALRRQASAASTQSATAARVARRYNDSDQYCLIVGSLPTMEDAERFVAKSGDSSLRVLEMDGKFRVCAATGATFAQAQAQTAALGRVYRGAWVCRR